MANRYQNVLSNEDIDYILNLPEVLTAKNNIDSKITGSVYFTIVLTPTIRTSIYNKMGLDLTGVDSIPMRWIKGDTLPHIDTGVDKFDTTHLIYLTNSSGELIVGESSFPILQNNAYTFNEGLNHMTVDTGLEPRLLLGPMSERGFVVGGIPLVDYPLLVNTVARVLGNAIDRRSVYNVVNAVVVNNIGFISAKRLNTNTALSKGFNRRFSNNK